MKKNKGLVLLQHSSGLMRFVPSVETSLALKQQQPAFLNVCFCLLAARGASKRHNFFFFFFSYFPVLGDIEITVSLQNVNNIKSTRCCIGEYLVHNVVKAHVD